MPVKEVATAVTWVKDALTTEGGTAVVTSDEADWKQAPDRPGRYPLVRRHALYVTANQLGNDAVAEPFFVIVECEGGLSGGGDPPEMSGVRFYLGQHATGAGTALRVTFGRDGEDIENAADRWVLPWRCSGTFKLRQDIQVEFGARLVVDTYGMFQLENPWVSPQSGQSFTTGGGRNGLPVGLGRTWNWHARLATDATGFVPMLRIAFARR